MSDEFKKGDVVVLKSGGPSMTVHEVQSSQLYCIWFDGTKKLGDYFDPETVEPAARSSDYS
jgi:uncharacterized protein YodC (DUF2158 family)